MFKVGDIVTSQEFVGLGEVVSIKTVNEFNTYFIKVISSGEIVEHALQYLTFLERPSEKNQTEGIKNDQSKPDLTDIPKEAMWEMGAAFTYGQKKYGKSNFRNGMAVSRTLAAAIRHIYQHLDGETIDPETGTTTHLGHAMASLAMAIYNLKNNPHLDDRFEKDIKKHEQN